MVTALILIGAVEAKAEVLHHYFNTPFEITMEEQVTQGTIDVTGSVEREVTPDEIYVEIILDEKNEKMKVTIDKLEAEMIAQLKKIGVDIENDLSVSDMESQLKMRFVKRAKPRTAASYELKVKDADMLAKAFDVLQEVGISNMEVVRVDHSKIKEIEQEMRIGAIIDAKDRATSIAAAIGQEVGKAVRISDYNVGRPMADQVMLRSASYDQMSESGAQGTSLDFMKMKLYYNISASFHLK